MGAKEKDERAVKGKGKSVMTKRKSRAQAATELAVFGAILIFVIASILRSAAGSGIEQNANLKAMRWAFLQSLYGVRDMNNARVTASVLVIEDRLSPDPGKFGSLERNPTIHSATGTFSNTMLLPTDWLEYENISVTDLFVNNEHFVFTTGRFIVYDVQLIPDAEPGKEVRVWDLTNNTQTFYPKAGNWKDDCQYTKKDGTVVNVGGCPMFQTAIPVNFSKFCLQVENNPDCEDQTLSTAQRFDLNRDGNPDNDPPVAARENFSWQWLGVQGLVKNKALEVDVNNAVFPAFDIDFDRREEVIFGINTPFSVMAFAPLSELGEILAPIVRPPPTVVHDQPSIIHPLIQTDSTDLQIKNPDVAQRFYVLDNQKGDINFAVDDLDRDKVGDDVAARQRLAVGLQRDVAIYTFTKEGTYLEINEGKAYVPGTGEFVRSANKRDQVDLVSRMYQLSNNTGRYCNANNARVETIGGFPGGLPNPVEFCVNSVDNPSNTCVTDVTINRTCLDVGTNMLFIRSRIEDKRGRKWITKTQ